ncbi:hypothetical protein EHO61_07670 [Leptospira fluminis]|uniref:Histidine kinase N-terminal 7TM region domain-containing protein n=1 Tax=Leptospira fluminis TaxID=2484979 RepID=A0A4R9GQ89_9LEPT|nr:histidine kinase N-terminal 7TM domain-containing protein [Leptospira fluminis]TGK19341.1 hypothetical protein EHO61_07670 [Leptospira fluminis]
MAFITFLILSISGFFFYKNSTRNSICKAYALIAVSSAIWALLKFLAQFDFPFGLQSILVDLIPIPTLFIPILLTYVTWNYTSPTDSTFPFSFLMVLHGVAILSFLYLSVTGVLTPFRLESGEVIYRGGISYFVACFYIYFSVLFCLGVLVRNIFRGDYLLRLRSIYMFVGIFLGGFFSAIFVVVLPLTGLYELSHWGVLGLLPFLWFSWVPIAKEHLFNTELLDFKQDLRNPKFSNSIIFINRCFLNYFDEKSFKEVCDKYEAEQRKILLEMTAKLSVEQLANPSGFKGKMNSQVEKIMNLFLRF